MEAKGIKRGQDDIGPFMEIEIRDGVSIKIDPPLRDFICGLRLGVRKTDDVRWVYAYHMIRGFGKEVALHRLLLGAAPGEICDHINGDTLDNRLRNLRICTNAENLRNTQRRAPHGSKFKGVTRIKGTDKWRAQIMKDGKKFNLGCFLSEEFAAKVYDAAARELFGEFARCNFPKPELEAVPHA
jgi:hypothetical protein